MSKKSSEKYLLAINSQCNYFVTNLYVSEELSFGTVIEYLQGSSKTSITYLMVTTKCVKPTLDWPCVTFVSHFLPLTLNNIKTIIDSVNPSSKDASANVDIQTDTGIHSGTLMYVFIF